jgi:hypothetical protein
VVTFYPWLHISIGGDNLPLVTFSHPWWQFTPGYIFPSVVTIYPWLHFSICGDNLPLVTLFHLWWQSTLGYTFPPEVTIYPWLHFSICGDNLPLVTLFHSVLVTNTVHLGKAVAVHAFCRLITVEDQAMSLQPALVWTSGLPSPQTGGPGAAPLVFSWFPIKCSIFQIYMCVYIQEQMKQRAFSVWM